MPRLVALVAAVIVLSTAPTAQAQLTSPIPPGTNYLYSVPGVVNGGNFGTVFMCTSTSTASQSVTVDVFDQNAMAAGSGSLVVGPGKTVLFATRTTAGLFYDLVVGPVPIQKGSARILSTDKKLMCSASLVDAVDDPPNFMSALNVVAKLKQKAAN